LHHIGSQRQFFFDDAIVEKMERTRRRLNTAVKVEANPIIRRDRPWEGSDTRMVGVFFDHSLGKFRLRYSTGEFFAEGRDEEGQIVVRGEHDSTHAQRRICEAFSIDGIEWEKPNLGLVEYDGSTENNILPDSAHMQRSYIMGGFFEDRHDPDPSRRYKGLRTTGSVQDKGMTISLFYSPDAYNWTAYSGNPIIDIGNQVGRWGPTFFLGWDPIRNLYAVHLENNLHMRSPYDFRSIGRAESPDMIHWSAPETILVPDEYDFPDTEFYAMPTTFYEGWHLGFLWIFSTTNTMHHPQFVFSRDGIAYNREYRDPVISRGDNGDFDSVSVYAMEPIIHSDEIFCFYYAANWRSPEQLLDLGDRATAGIGLAKLPLDGFVSFESGRHEFSEVTTRSFTFSGSQLFLNIRAALQQWGAGPCEVRVELLDERHSPLKGYTKAESDVVTTTSINRQISWQSRSDVSELAGRPVRLKITFRNAKLYAFQFK
jgi:hypothetical protein